VNSTPAIRLGLDIGGTFADVALEVGERRFTGKTLTTPGAPEEGVLTALRSVTEAAGIEPGQVDLIIHGTTLATNAVIERKGAKTALLTTEGFRDVIEIRHENRFEQYDVNIDLPPPLVPRRLRFPVRERIDAQGNVLVPLDEASLAPADVDVVNAHGSATPLGDRAEALAYERLFGEHLAAIPVCATKGQHGHALGATGAWEIAISAMSMREGVIPGAVNLERIDDECAVRCSRETVAARTRIVLSNSSGFGGINAALVLRAAE